MRITLAAALAATASILAVPTSAFAAPDGSATRDVTLDSAIEDTLNNRVSLPLRKGRTTDGRAFGYVVTESSNPEDADRRGVNRAPKLARAAGTRAVRPGRFVDGVLVVPATVDFSPDRIVVPGPNGFPPAQADPGSLGEEGYTPLVQLPGGTVINAPHVANATGEHDKLVSRDGGRGSFNETEGFYNGKEPTTPSVRGSARRCWTARIRSTS